MKTDEQILKEIGIRVKKIREGKTTRKGKKWSQAHLAAAIDSSTSQISLIETGKREPGILMLYRIARALECEIEELITK